MSLPIPELQSGNGSSAAAATGFAPRRDHVLDWLLWQAALQSRCASPRRFSRSRLDLDPVLNLVMSTIIFNIIFVLEIWNRPAERGAASVEGRVGS
jgi:hypothetical protein